MSRYEDIIKACERNAIPDSEINCSEIPPINDFSGFHFKMGKGWQTKLNDFLMEAVAKGEI